METKVGEGSVEFIVMHVIICVLVTSHTAILKREIINGSVHQEFRKNLKSP